jgi:hypothetical protein
MADVAVVPASELSPPSLSERIGASLFLCAALLASLGILAGAPLLANLALAPMLIFLLLELRSVPRLQAAIALGLLTLGVVMLAIHGGMLHGLLAGGRGAMDLLLLFAGVTFIQYPALHSPSTRQLSEAVANQSPGRRYLSLSVSSHILGSLINLAALALLTSTLARPMADDTRRRMVAAVTRGFATASNWSPFFIGITVILTQLPQLRWSDLAPWGLGLALVQLVTGFFWDRLRNPRRSRPAKVGPVAGTGQALRRIAPLVLVLAAVPVGAELCHLPMSVVIVLTVPPISLLWQWAIVRGTASGGGEAADGDGASSFRGMIYRITTGMAGLRTEVLMFLGANVLGQGAAQLFDGPQIAAWLQGAGLTGWVAIALLASVMTGSAAFGVHPVVLVVLVGQSIAPQAVGIAPITMALIMATAWGLGVTISPLSGLSLYVSRVARQGLLRTSLVGNGGYALMALVMCIVFIGLHEQLVRAVGW